MEKLNIPQFDRSLHILVVDDEPANLTIISKMLSPYQCHVSCVSSGKEALQFIKKDLPDVILLDVMMPGMNGFEVCEALKSNELTRLIPIIIVTALQERDDRIKGIEAGCDDFISKPIDRLELTARVHALARVKRLNDDLDHAQSVVLSLARAVEAKDNTTGDHCDRLIRLSRQFGEFLKLSDNELFVLEQSGILHDVGKIGIPDAILLKPGPLNNDEWNCMREHPIMGEEICYPLKSLRNVCPIIRHHHEKYNGTGYPDGLMGESIPYLARVFQILDAYDALTHKRPYKDAFSKEKSLEILRDETTQGLWDPQLIDAFEKFIRESDDS